MSEGNRVDQLLEAIHQARARVYQIGNATPLESMSIEGVNQSIWVKREDLGPIKAYKWRGAFNAMACLTPAQLEGGVVAASVGNHAQGIALACNAVGTDYHLMARRAKKEGLSDPAVKKTFSDLLKDARRHHKEHLSLSSDDTRSKFTAASNLGLVATDLGDADTAMNNFQTALKAATAVGDARMQSVALANLGMHAMTVGNLEMTNKCMEQRLELVLTTHDDREEAKTLLQRYCRTRCLTVVTHRTFCLYHLRRILREAEHKHSHHRKK